jgi:hypothetical protein
MQYELNSVKTVGKELEAMEKQNNRYHGKEGYYIATCIYLIVIGVLMVKVSGWWFLAYFLWHWKCLWEPHSEHPYEQ